MHVLISSIYCLSCPYLMQGKALKSLLRWFIGWTFNRIQIIRFAMDLRWIPSFWTIIVWSYQEIVASLISLHRIGKRDWMTSYSTWEICCGSLVGTRVWHWGHHYGKLIYCFKYFRDPSVAFILIAALKCPRFFFELINLPPFSSGFLKFTCNNFEFVICYSFYLYSIMP